MHTHPQHTHVRIFLSFFWTRRLTNGLLLHPAACGNGLIRKRLVDVAMGITSGEMEISKGSWNNWGGGGERARPGPGRMGLPPPSPPC